MRLAQQHFDTFIKHKRKFRNKIIIQTIVLIIFTFVLLYRVSLM